MNNDVPNIGSETKMTDAAQYMSFIWGWLQYNKSPIWMADYNLNLGFGVRLVKRASGQLH